MRNVFLKNGGCAKGVKLVDAQKFKKWWMCTLNLYAVDLL